METAWLSENSHPGLCAFPRPSHPALAFAKPLTASGISTCLYDSRVGPRCTAKERDAETGLDYFGARYFSAAQGRFTSPDPLFMNAKRLSSPNALNLYSYARNNPLKFVDPSGREVRMVNDTEEGRRIAMAYQKRGMTAAEAANVGYKSVNGKTVMYLKDAKAVDMSKASIAYKELAGRIGSSTVFNYGVMGNGLSATFPDFGKLTGYSGAGVVSPASDGSINCLVDRSISAQVKVSDGRGGEVLGDEPPFMTAMHEVLAETLKYTEGHADLLSNRAKDNLAVIGIENAIRSSLGMPLRTGSDHHGERASQEAQAIGIPYDPSPIPSRLE